MIQTSEKEFKNFLEKNNEPLWLTEYRKNAFNKIATTDMPSFRHGLNIIVKPDTEHFFLTTPKNQTETKIKFQNENGIKTFVGNEITKEIFEQNPEIRDFFTNIWLEEDEQNKITCFNEAFANKFIILKIPENFSSEETIKIDYEIKNSINIISIIVLAEENSKAKILLNRSGEKSYFSENIKIILKRNSNVQFVSSQNFDNTTISFQKRKAICEENSEILWTDICLGTDYTNSSIISLLKGKESKSNAIVLYLAKDTQKYDIYTASIHANENTNSNIVTKGVINGSAKALSRGLVKIQENAQKSNGYETQDALLLSEEAEADAIPNLEIHNHDVKCSHGSTVSQIDAEKLFYLMSRGLNEKLAKQKIIEGYFSPTLKIVNDDKLNREIHEFVMNYIK